MSRIEPLDAYSTYKEYKPLLFNKYKGCQSCGNRNYYDLVIHHVTYERYGNETPSDLRLLCKTCHDALHRKVRGTDPDLRRATNAFIKGDKWW